MKNKAKLILASAVFVAALMLLVPLSQIDISGGGGTGNSNSDSIVLSNENIQYNQASQPSDVEFIYNSTSKILTKNFYANGTPIVLSDFKNGNELIGVTITYDGQSSPINISKKDTTYDTNKDVSGVIINVFGGSKDANVLSSNITVNGGLLTKIYGGGYGTSESNTAHVKDVIISVTNGTFEKTSPDSYDSGIVGGGLVYSTVETVSIAMSGGSTQYLIGGGLHSSTGSSAGSASNPYLSVSNKTTITVSGNANIDYLFGGAQGFGSVNESVINFTDGTTKELIGSGSNGKTLKTTINISGGTVTNYAFTVNRGAVADSATINVTNGTVAALYAGAAQESKDTTGTITGTTSLKVSGGNVSKIYLGLGLNDANVALDIGNNTIYAQGGADGTANLFKDYTIASGKTWTLTSGTLEIKKDSSITNSGTFTNNGTIVVKDLKGLRSAAAIGGNIQLAANIEIKGMNSALELIDGTTLDLNGHTITIEQIGKSASEIKDSEKYISKGNLNANVNRIVTADGATVIIKDGTINYTEKSEETGTEKTKSPVKVGGTTASSKLTLDNVSIESTEYGVGVFKNGTLIVNNPNDTVIDGYISSITTNGSANSSPLTSDGAKIELNGGNYTSTDAAVIYFPGGESLKVTGGIFEGPTGFDIRAGTVKIKDATVKATGNTTSKFSAANGPSGWGMGIAVFDHSSYAENSEINITIDNVTFDCTTCNIFVGKHPGDNKSGDVSFSDTRIFNPSHTINVTINDVDFETKGLYINGANDVTITGCTFTNISESPISATDPNLYSNAIYLLNCKGDITIGGASKADGNIISADASKPLRGIYLDNCGDSNKTLSIKYNTISDVDFNTIQITNASFSEINISNNTISNWDDDADGGNVKDSLYEKGRAIRITATSQPTIKLSENTFSKDYLIEKTYDTSNIIKITDRSGGSITKTTLSSNTAEISFIADSTAAYADGLAISNEDFFGSGYESDDTKMNITVGADDENNKTHFITKGLYIKGTNDVTIQNCEFTDITEMIEASPDAIRLVGCTGTIVITDNKISNVAVDNSDKPDMGMGINIAYEAANATGSITISDNVIENIAHNAITVQSKSDKPVANILIEDNILSNWDSDSSNNTSENNNDLYYGGRAIRLATEVHLSGTSIISENTFIKAYTDSNRDDGNILKATSCSPEFKDNVLRLTGITDYSGNELFKFDDGKARFLVTFNANGGYFLDDSSNTNLYSLFVASNGSAAVTEPTDPSRSGSYSLNGWYDAATGGKEWDFTTDTITADKTLYANWTYTGGSGGVPVTPPEEPVVKEEEIENEDGTISSITETTVTKENDDGSKETIVEKEEVVKDKDGNVQSVIEEKQSEVVNKDGSTNKTSEKVVKDKDGKVIEEKTEIEIEDKNTGVSTSVEVTKGSDGKTASEITTQTSVETKDGKAQVDSKTLDEALKQAEAAKKAAEEKGAKDAKPVIEINAENSEDFTETEISADDLSKLAEAEVDVKIKTATGEVNIPPEVSKNLSSNADEKVSLSFGEADKQKLTEEQKKTVGDAPVFEFNLKSGENDIHDLGGTVSVTVPYELKAGEDPNKITVWYIDEQGNPVAMNSVYDPETKSITFETSHFSYYFIAEDTAVPDDKKDDSNNNTIYYAVAAVIVILIIIALAYYFMKKKQ